MCIALINTDKQFSKVVAINSHSHQQHESSSYARLGQNWILSVFSIFIILVGMHHSINHSKFVTLILP